MNDKINKLNDNETLRPLARTMARELSNEEVARITGAFCGFYSRSGCNPIQTGDWDQHH